MELADLGWDEGWAAAAAAHADDGLAPARVAIEHRGAYEVLAEAGAVTAELPGRAYRAARDRRELPAVGDWVMVEGAEAAAGTGAVAVVRAILPRRGLLVRKAAGARVAAQPLAANVDVGLIVTAADRDLSPRRLERYLAFVRAGGARPVIVLNKVDLCDDPAPLIAELAAAAPGVAIVTASATGGDAAAVAATLGRGATGVLCGSSGVGKSTMLGALAVLAGAGLDARPTRTLGVDGRGRHTTARRELFVLPGGGVVIDTPGMRELALWDADADDAGWADLEALAAACRFADCRHAREPGCAVRAAVDDGRLDPARLAGYQKLAAETAAGAARRAAAARAEDRRKAKVATRALRRRLDDKDR